MSHCVDVLDKIEWTTELPVTVAEVLRHLHLDGATEHEADITGILRDAIDYVEGETDLTLCVCKYRWTLDYFPSARLTLPVRPVLDVPRFRYRDVAGDWQTVDQTLYRVDGLAEPPVIRLLPTTTWPTTYADSWGTVEIDIVAGNQGLERVPSQAKRAILLLAGHWFANREALLVGSISKELEFTVSALCAQIAGREVL